MVTVVRAADGSGFLTPTETYDLVTLMPDDVVVGTIRDVQFSALYDAGNSSVSFGLVTMLITEDGDPGKANESRRMIESIFGEARTYRVRSGVLELSSGDGEVLTITVNGPALQWDIPELYSSWDSLFPVLRRRAPIRISHVSADIPQVFDHK